MTDNLKNIIESLIFVSETPLTLDRIQKSFPHADIHDIRSAIETLIQEHESRKGSFFLKEVAGGYQFRTRPEYHEWIKNLIQPNPVRLSKAALETLAIIAYKQPIIRNDIEHIRGVDCGGIIRTLMERKLVRILGRKEIPGRPLIYATTKYFLEFFDLKDLKDLPTPKEIEAMDNLSETTVGENESCPESVTEERKKTLDLENTRIYKNS
jgi:segregation and condensation protein B